MNTATLLRLVNVAPVDTLYEIKRALYGIYPDLRERHANALIRRNWLRSSYLKDGKYACTCGDRHKLRRDEVEFAFTLAKVPLLVKWLGYNGYHQYASETRLAYAALLLQQNT